MSWLITGILGWLTKHNHHVGVRAEEHTLCTCGTSNTWPWKTVWHSGWPSICWNTSLREDRDLTFSPFTIFLSLICECVRPIFFRANISHSFLTENRLQNVFVSPVWGFTSKVARVNSLMEVWLTIFRLLHSGVSTVSNPCVFTFSVSLMLLIIQISPVWITIWCHSHPLNPFLTVFIHRKWI